MCLCFSWTRIIHLFSIFIYFLVFARSLFHFIDLHNRLAPAEASLKIAGECQPAAGSRRFWPVSADDGSARSFIRTLWLLSARWFCSKCTKKKLKKAASVVLHPTLQPSQRARAHQSGLTCFTRLRWGDTNAELHIFFFFSSAPSSPFHTLPFVWLIQRSGLALAWLSNTRAYCFSGQDGPPLRPEACEHILTEAPKSPCVNCIDRASERKKNCLTFHYSPGMF